MSVIQNITGGYSASAKVVDGTLVLSLPDAISPVVWRMDLGTAKSSAIEVRENSDSQYDLVLKTPKADAHVIATYLFKIKATHALMAITKAMKKAEGQMPIIPLDLSEEDRARYLPVPVSASKPKMTVWRWVLRGLKYVVVLLCMFVVFGTVWTFLKIKARQSLQAPVSVEAPAQLQQKSSQQNKIGEVMSADDFLKGR